MHLSHTPSPERGGFSWPCLHAAFPNSGSHPPGQRQTAELKPSLGITASRWDYEDEDDDEYAHADQTELKALGRRRLKS
jgi:hypothetical protein